MGFFKSFCALATIAAFAAGCTEQPKPAPAPKPVYECSVQLKQNPTIQPIKASASGPDEAVAKREAMNAACDQLPNSKRAFCADATRFKASVSTGTMQSGDTKTFTMTVKLTQVRPSISGKSTSNIDGEDACKKATLEACKIHGADTDCVAAGTHKRTSKFMRKR